MNIDMTPSPYSTVARLTLPCQDCAGVAAHRPLGDVQRARKVVYFESQKGRGAV